MGENEFSSHILHTQPDDDPLGCKDGWIPESTTKFGCDGKMRSIQEEEFSKTWVGLFMIWLNPYCEGANQIFEPVVVLSLIYQFLDLILKSPSTIIKCELDSARVSRISSKLSENFSKPSLVWLGDR